LQPVRNRIILFTVITAVFVIFLSFLFAWRSSLTERIFLERVRPAGTANTGINIFYNFKRIFLDLADRISTEESRLDISLRTIETQTALIRTQTIDRIRKALISGDEAMSLTILRDCVSALPKTEDPLIAGLLARMLSAMIRDINPREETPEYVPGSQEEIFGRYYPDCFTRICESVRVHKEKDISALGRKVLAYINEHLYDPNLYITMVADHFNISAPTLQKLVKQCAGQTFQNYVEKGRLEHACELLLNSTDTITHIASACGFSNSTSFNRSFNRIYGFPPSRFKENKER
jgi:AraC-like DNA-binding protein